MDRTLRVNQREYTILRLLGRGKGGYSYLAVRDGHEYVVKQIHHEPCDYYTFGNKIASEHRDYARLLQAGIRIPRMLDIDFDSERLVKEFIDGPTVYQLVERNALEECCLAQVREMARQARNAGLNIDYFPTNFVLRQGLLYYIDYECNPYSPEWSFERWGVRYWSRTPEFLEHAARQDK